MIKIYDIEINNDITTENIQSFFATLYTTINNYKEKVYKKIDKNIYEFIYYELFFRLYES